MTEPFKFIGAYAHTGETSAGPGAAERLHPLYPTNIVGANGFMLVLNGYNVNRRVTDVLGFDGDPASAVYALQLTAPNLIMMPLISYAGNGQIFGLGYKWRYRWKNSRTGEYSGLSPSPSEAWNLGMETFPGSNQFLGQTAFFRVPLSDAPPGVDTIQIFRNSSAEEDIWYLISEQSTVGASYVNFTDTTSDDDLFNAAEIVSLANSSGPSFDQGVMPPVAKVYLHPTGRVAYYGLRRYGAPVVRTSTSSSVSPGDTSIVVSASIEEGRVGQRLRLGAYGASINDSTVYRIVSIQGTTIHVYPALKTSTALPSANSTVTFTVEDDRDGRAIYFSEPGQPWLIDPFKTIYVGHDSADEVLHMFSVGGITHVQTKQAIYRLLNDQTEDPSLSVFIQAASDEGCVGLEAGVETAFGWAYVHHGLGVRLFDGNKSYPVGGEDEYTVFIANTQYQNIEMDAIGECKLAWDHDKKLLLFSYVPNGKSSHSECLAFDPMTKTWRGPWRQRLFSSGSMRTVNGDEVFVAGDDFGNLYKNDVQALDMVDPNWTTTGTIGTQSTAGALLYPSSIDTTKDFRGCPIWIKRVSTGVYYYSVIANVVNSTTVLLQFPPVDEDGNVGGFVVNDTWAIGAIRWSMMTSYIDAGEPVLPKKLEHLMLRFRRGVAGGDFLVDVALDGDITSFLGEKLASTSPAVTVSPTSSIFKKVRLSREGRAFTIRLRGQSTSGHPQITGAMAELDIRGGA